MSKALLELCNRAAPFCSAEFVGPRCANERREASKGQPYMPEYTLHMPMDLRAGLGLDALDLDDFDESA